MTTVHDLYYYAEDSPSGLRWKCNRYGGNRYNRIVAHKDSVAGSAHKTMKYWYVSNGSGKLLRAHRVVWSLFNGTIPEKSVIDHIDGNVLNNVIQNLRCVSYEENVRNCGRSKNNTSGITGVCMCSKGSYTYWVASWWNLNGKQSVKQFSTNKYGYEQAFNLACAYRQQMIDLLNQQGAGYTERHGKGEF